MSNYFEGFYFKHQKEEHVLSVIPGKSHNLAFIQVITAHAAYQFTYPAAAFKKGRVLRLGKCEFSKNGIHLDIHRGGTSIYGDISYKSITPIKYDIMGIFKYLPMECRHGILSLHHKLEGYVNIDGKILNFNGGTGYIEKDSGTSFPKSYLWVQCNAFKEKCSIVASVADIPFMGMQFKGCICIVYYKGKEYRLATYLGVKIKYCDEKRLFLEQGKYRLEIEVKGDHGQKLLAPNQGQMTRTVFENVACSAHFKFFIHKKPLFCYHSEHASYEYVGEFD